MRILHISDVHVGLPAKDLLFAEFHPKRAAGALNLAFRRGPQFAEAESKLAKLATFAREQNVDLTIASGDFTAVGTLEEMTRATEALAPFTRVGRGLVCVPGNHDVYVDEPAKDRFAEVFRRRLGEHVLPSVLRVDADIAIVCVDTVRSNPQIWRSSGLVGQAKLAELARSIDELNAEGRLILVVGHYALRRADNTPDSALHGLVDAEQLIGVLANVRRGAYLHGHIHHRYQLPKPLLPIQTFCAGSATQAGREGFWLYDLATSPGGAAMSATPGAFEEGAYALRPSTAVKLELL